MKENKIPIRIVIFLAMVGIATLVVVIQTVYLVRPPTDKLYWSQLADADKIERYGPDGRELLNYAYSPERNSVSYPKVGVYLQIEKIASYVQGFVVGVVATVVLITLVLFFWREVIPEYQKVFPTDEGYAPPPPEEEK